MKQTHRFHAWIAGVALLGPALLLPAAALAWGDKGHLIVAHLASRLLTQPAQHQVGELLAEGESLESVATWADGLRGSFQHPGQRPETPLWHFVDIPLNKDYDAVRDCPETPNGSCAIGALVAFQDVLARKRKGYYSNSRYEALKFIVHLVGDIHQPLHCVDDDDAGGNFKSVVWLDETIWKLHAVWDEAILARNMETAGISDPIAYANRLRSQLTAQQVQESRPVPGSAPTVPSRATIEGWAKDAHAIGNGAYADLPPKDPENRYRLETAYYDNHKAEVDDQLERAGIRLARMLNEALR